MDSERFEQLARSPARTRADLESMKANALSRGETELAHIAEEILRERFPIRTKVPSGRTPTTAIFRGHKEQFESGKDAYLWLVQEFKIYRPTIFDEYEALHVRAKSAGRRYARSPESLFPAGSPRAGNPSYYAKLGEGWYADINANHQNKFSALVQLGHLANLEFPRDWNFRVEGGTQELADQQKHQAIILKAQEMLDELLKLE